MSEYPILVCVDESQRKELTELCNAIKEHGFYDDHEPVIASTIDDAVDEWNSHYLHLLLTILPVKGQGFYDALRKAGYNDDFIVAGSGNYDKREWAGRKVRFLKLSGSRSLDYQKIQYFWEHAHVVVKEEPSALVEQE